MAGPRVVSTSPDEGRMCDARAHRAAPWPSKMARLRFSAGACSLRCKAFVTCPVEPCAAPCKKLQEETEVGGTQRLGLCLKLTRIRNCSSTQAGRI